MALRLLLTYPSTVLYSGAVSNGGVNNIGFPIGHPVMRLGGYAC